MSMIKTVLVGAFLALTSTGWAEALYWMLDAEEDTGSSAWFVTDGNNKRIEFDAAGVKTEGGKSLYIMGDDGSSLGITTIPADFTAFPDNASLLPDDSSTMSFLIELYNQGTPVAQSESKKYDELIGSIAKDASTAGITAWTPAAFTAVPEPTSGLLALFGAAMLALKRRRA